MPKLIFVVLVVISFFIPAISAKSEKIKDSAIESLIMGINSENFGLRTSSAYLLGEFKCDKAIIPLLKMLKSEGREDARIVAALALLKIGDSRGIYAIKQAIRFDDSERVKRLCTNFYHAYLGKLSDVKLMAHK